MNDEGADLAARAIVAWLMRSDDETKAVQADVRRHIAQPLAPIASSSRRSIVKELDYIREKLYLATLSLTSGTGDICERLESAAIGLSGVSNSTINLPNRIRGARSTFIDSLMDATVVDDTYHHCDRRCS